jgi:hypothetical protein
MLFLAAENRDPIPHVVTTGEIYAEPHHRHHHARSGVRS